MAMMTIAHRSTCSFFYFMYKKIFMNALQIFKQTAGHKLIDCQMGQKKYFLGMYFSGFFRLRAVAMLKVRM